MLDQLKSLIQSHDIISFDLFDTLLLRPYIIPTDVFLHIGRIINKKEFFNERTKNYIKYTSIIFKLFNFIPLLKIKEFRNKKEYYLFNFILIYKIKYKSEHKSKHYLFGFIPITKITK